MARVCEAAAKPPPSFGIVIGDGLLHISGC